jgi:phosphate/sulfate permease
MLVCLAHGSNDVANAITPLLVIEAAHGNSTSKLGYWVGSIGIALGLLTLGSLLLQ